MHIGKYFGFFWIAAYPLSIILSIVFLILKNINKIKHNYFTICIYYWCLSYLILIMVAYIIMIIYIFIFSDFKITYFTIKDIIVAFTLYPIIWLYYASVYIFIISIVLALFLSTLSNK